MLGPADVEMGLSMQGDPSQLKAGHMEKVGHGLEDSHGENELEANNSGQKINQHADLVSAILDTSEEINLNKYIISRFSRILRKSPR